MPGETIDCPRCKLPLSRESYEGVEVDLCQACWGMWLDTGELEAIIASHQFRFSPEEKKLVIEGRGPRQKGPVEPVACPRCAGRMERIYLDTQVHLVVDRCPRHGFWLDAGEIKALQVMAEKSRAVSSLLIRKLKGHLEPRK
jgi:Zn-finger nucleic acid-binding protein